MYTFGELVRGFRKREGITQQELAYRLRVHRNTISNWERNYLPSTRDQVLNLADELRLSRSDTEMLLIAAQYPLEFESKTKHSFPVYGRHLFDEIAYRTSSKRSEEGQFELTDWIVGERTPILLDRKTLQEVMNGNPRQIEVFLFERIRYLKRQYRVFGNPLLIYNAAQGIASEADHFLEKRLYQLGKLHEFLGYILVNANPNIHTIKLAKSHLEKAFNIFDNLNLFNNEILASYLRVSWLIAVTDKMQGEFDKAYNFLNETLQDKYIQRVATIRETIPLIRQRVIMEQTRQSHEELLETLDQYKDTSVEYFHSLRRIFEYALNTQEEKAIDGLYKLSLQAFSKTQSELDQVYVYSYLKNIYHYHKLKNEEAAAERIFNYVFEGTLRLELFGQHRQIISIRNMFATKDIPDIRLEVAVYSQDEDSKNKFRLMI